MNALSAGPVLPDLVLAEVPLAKKRASKNIEDIRKKPMKSIKNPGFKDYTYVDLKLDNEETCLEALKKLELAEDARRRIIYFSCLKGEVLKRLKNIIGKKMSQLLRMTKYSQGYAYVLINLYELAQKYNKLIYSDLPISFIKINLKEIEKICKDNELFFK